VLGDVDMLNGNALRDRVVSLEAELADAQRQAGELRAEHERLREAYRQLQLTLELQRRRLFIAKAERIDTSQLELEFAATLAKLDELAGELPANDDKPDASGDDGEKTTIRRKPTGRRNLRTLAFTEERIEVPDPDFDGKVERIGIEETCQMMWRRGGMVRVVTVRFKYRTASTLEPAGTSITPVSAPAPRPVEEVEPAVIAPFVAAATAAEESREATVIVAGSTPEATTGLTPAAPASTTSGFEEPAPVIVTAPIPPQILPRCIATASLLAHIASDKLCDGLPLYRQEDRFARLGFRIDRGSMSRWLEELGMIMGSSIVHAMRVDALTTAFCISTDATGVLVQPLRDGSQQRRACRRGHYFVQIADADHIFFEYTPRETSAAVGEMFRGFSGYIQADAKSVYDFLFRPPEQRGPADDEDVDRAVRLEVGCWSHVRTKFWEAAVTTKDVVAREGLARIRRIFELDRSWRGRPHAEIKSLRDIHLRPHVDAFFAWVVAEYDKVRNQRGFLRTALGYACRQRGPLTRFFDDGRLCLDNNASERALRRIAVGRKAWLFVGSDDHAEAAGNLMTLIASARLHGLDPELYLRDIFRVFPHWPRDRYLELCPRDWRGTRARLDPKQLEAELGHLDIPPRAPSEQPATR
jgi:transposase